MLIKGVMVGVFIKGGNQWLLIKGVMVGGVIGVMGVTWGLINGGVIKG